MAKFTITNRKGEKSLWVNGQNIWDLKKSELTPDVKKAIISAYYIGKQHVKKEIDSLNLGRFGFDKSFTEEDIEK